MKINGKFCIISVIFKVFFAQIVKRDEDNLLTFPSSQWGQDGVHLCRLHHHRGTQRNIGDYVSQMVHIHVIL